MSVFSERFKRIMVRPKTYMNRHVLTLDDVAKGREHVESLVKKKMDELEEAIRRENGVVPALRFPQSEMVIYVSAYAYPMPPGKGEQFEHLAEVVRFSEQADALRDIFLDVPETD